MTNKNILANCDGNVYLPILHLPRVEWIALQVARKIAPCDRALIHVCLAYLFLHSEQVLSSFKCYFKRKYLNLIDSNTHVDESCPWFFIGTVLATGPECIIVIHNAWPRPKFNPSPNWTEGRISPNVPKFRSVNWTHDMIIVKWHLLTLTHLTQAWHKRKHCALTNRPPAQSTRTGQWLSKLFDANGSAAQVYVLHPWKFIFGNSSYGEGVF